MSRRCCGNDAAANLWGGNIDAKKLFCSKLAVPEEARDKCIRGTGGKGNVPNKISQGKGVCICMLKAKRTSSLFNRLFARDKRIGEAKVCRTPVAACTLGDLAMLVITWCHTGGQLLGLNAGEFGLLWQEPGWGGCCFGPSSSSGAGTCPSWARGKQQDGSHPSVSALPPPPPPPSHFWAERGC